MSKKNLDKLFQEKFKEFSDIPTENVWKSIEASLNKKKKSRKVIPIWWKLGGIAAALAIGFFLINPFEAEIETNPIITNVETPLEKNGQEQNTLEQEDMNTIPPANTIDLDENTAVVASDKNSPETKEALNATSNTIDKTSSDLNNAVVSQEANPNLVKKQQIVEADTLVSKHAVAASTSERKGIEQELPTNDDNAVAVRTNSNIPSLKEEETDRINNTSSAIADVNTGDKSEIDGIAVSDTQLPQNDVEDNQKKSIYDEIALQEEVDVVDADNVSKWSAGPSIAPVYFNGIGEGSPVHSIFVPNSKSGDVNLSYGLAVSYEISKKLSIKTGVHKVDYGYNTNDVEFSASIEGFGNGQIDNIDYSLASRNIVVESKAAKRTSFAADAASEVAAKDASLNGIMAQQLGYVEIPLELNYALLDRKFGVNIIGGISSLFLVDNSVTLTSGELITEMGEANNVNDVNFSTNIGFGVNYKFTPKIQFNVEPVFKYQLNTFSETSGDFQPFTIGIYSGLNFKF